MQTLQRDGLADPRQSQVRGVIAFFSGNSELCDSLFRGLRQGAQPLSALDAGPENARVACIRELAETLDGNIDDALDGHRL